MEQFQCPDLDCLPRLTLANKNSSSVPTQTGSNIIFRSSISITSSASYTSVPQNKQYGPALQLFASYLFEKDDKQQKEILKRMRNFYEKVGRQESYPSITCLNLKKNVQDVEGQLMSYFGSIWMRDMGYGSRQTQKMIMRMVKIYLGDQKVSKFMQLYKHMELLNLSLAQKKELLLSTCKNGWQQYVRFIIKNEFE